MASTNKTTNYELSQFIGTDKPTFLGDYNGDMQKIDTAIAGVGATASGASSTAASALSEAQSASSTAASAATTAATADTNATSALATAGNAATAASAAQTAASAVDTKVGALTDLTTTDKTAIVAAINEVNTAASNAATAASDAATAASTADGKAVAVDTKVGDLTDLTTTDKTSIVNAINEVAQGGGGSSHNYSTTEHVVGKWVDGTTDVYEKTIVDAATTKATAGNRVSFETAALVSGAEMIIDAMGEVKLTSSSNQTVKLSALLAQAGSALTCDYAGLLRIEPNSTDIKYQFTVDNSAANSTATVTLTIRYIKAATP